LFVCALGHGQSVPGPHHSPHRLDNKGSQPTWAQSTGGAGRTSRAWERSNDPSTLTPTLTQFLPLSYIPPASSQSLIEAATTCGTSAPPEANPLQSALLCLLVLRNPWLEH